jgi:hypothetical protein
LCHFNKIGRYELVLDRRNLPLVNLKKIL